MWCTLEPCCHHGKQPPCTDALIEAGIARVIYARTDPGEVSRGGAEVLRTHRIAVELSTASPHATRLADPFIKRMRTGLPWVIAKWAQTIDGRVATRTGESQWISSEASRRRVHRLRARVDAIVCGIGTAMADDPLLTARGVRRVRRVARRVVVDTDLDLPVDARLVTTAHEVPTTIACARSLVSAEITASKRATLAAAGVDVLGVPEDIRGGIDLESLLKSLADDHGAATVMIEAGPGLLGAMFEAELIDEAVVHLAPLMLGDEFAKGVARGRVAASLTMGRRFRLVHAKPVGDDVELVYRKPPAD